MKKFEGFENIGTGSQIQPGGYVLKILDVSGKTYTWGNVVIVSFDVVEGPQKDFYAKNYAGQTGEDKKWKGTFRVTEPKDDGTDADNKTKWYLKKFTDALEASNPGYKWDWDETKWKDKLIGGIFGQRYFLDNSGSEKMCVEMRFPATIEDIRAGRYEIPEKKLDQGATGNIGRTSTETSANNSATSFPFSNRTETEIPFN